jgi:hypothetical protein
MLEGERCETSGGALSFVVVVDAVGGSMRRWSRCEDRCAFGARERGCSSMALRLRRLQDRRRLGAVALAFDGVEAIVL